jgi:hypothetical protein
MGKSAVLHIDIFLDANGFAAMTYSNSKKPNGPD